MTWTKTLLAATAAAIAAAAANHAKTIYIDPHFRLSKDPDGYFISWTALNAALERNLGDAPPPWTALEINDASITLIFEVHGENVAIEMELLSLDFDFGQERRGATLSFMTPNHVRFEDPNALVLIFQMILMILGVVPDLSKQLLLPENIKWNGEEGSIFFELKPDQIPDWLGEHDGARFDLCHQRDGLVFEPLFTIAPNTVFKALSAGFKYYGPSMPSFETVSLLLSTIYSVTADSSPESAS